MVLDANDVVGVVSVVVAQMQQDLQLHPCLMLELLFVPDDLDCDVFSCFMVECLQRLAERSFAKEVNHFKPVSYVVTQHYIVVSSVVVEAEVVLVILDSFNLLRADAEEVDLPVVKDLALFELSYFFPFEIMLKNFCARQRKLNLLILRSRAL